MEALVDEEYHARAQEIPENHCGVCGKYPTSQAYEIVLRRPHITRRWHFCSLEHLRIGMGPVR
jgi:hypothetical protein